MISNEDFSAVVRAIGEFRQRHMYYFVLLDDTWYTWSDLGSDQRITEWLYGVYVRLNDGDDKDFDNWALGMLEVGAVLIKKYLASHYELPRGCTEKTWDYLANRCAKTIAFGATWPQVMSFIDKELDYATNHPKDKGRFDE
jgi:hypothetical protein